MGILQYFKSKIKSGNKKDHSLDFVLNHLLAVARLSMIKPEVLVRESRNVKANNEYLLKMIDVQNNLNTPKDNKSV